jgi:small subunit ribosomal protein S16
MHNNIRIRLARHGLRSRPVYHIVAIAAGKARNARPLEKLGEYDPIPVVRNTDSIPEAARIFGVKDQEVLRKANEVKREKTVTWDLGRIGWWITKGAEPTQRVRKLLRTVSRARPPRYKLADSMPCRGPQTGWLPLNRSDRQAGVIDSLSWSNHGAAKVREMFAARGAVTAPDGTTRMAQIKKEKGAREGKILDQRFDRALGKLQAQRDADPVWQSGRQTPTEAKSE